MHVTSSELVQEAAILMTHGKSLVLILREGLVIDKATAAEISRVVSAAHTADAPV